MDVLQPHFAFFFFFGLVGLALLVLQIWALIDIIRSNFADSSNKVIWVIIVLFLPLLGSILYFAVGRNQRIN